jgi:hypothetical protein
VRKNPFMLRGPQHERAGIIGNFKSLAVRPEPGRRADGDFFSRPQSSQSSDNFLVKNLFTLRPQPVLSDVERASPRCNLSSTPTPEDPSLRGLFSSAAFLFIARSFQSTGFLRWTVRAVRLGGLLSYVVGLWFRSTAASRFAWQTER